MWAIILDEGEGYGALDFVEPGDYLDIIDTETGEVVFSDQLKPDYTTGYMPYLLNPSCGQQVSNGMNVHWIQEGFDPDVWGKFFIGNFDVEMNESTGYRWGKRTGRYRGELYRLYNHPRQMTQETVDFWNMLDKMRQERENG